MIFDKLIADLPNTCDVETYLSDDSIPIVTKLVVRSPKTALELQRLLKRVRVSLLELQDIMLGYILPPEDGIEADVVLGCIDLLQQVCEFKEPPAEAQLQLQKLLRGKDSE